MTESTPKEETIRLLLVDDEAVFRNNITILLTGRGMQVVQTENGEAGLAALQTTTVHVVLLDVKMPGMGGLEVLRRIKAHHPGIEVILLTGQATTADGVEGIKTGAFDYLSKPVQIDHLAEKIRQAHAKQVMAETQLRNAEFREAMEKRMITADRLAALGTLAAGVAHEINNPLALIKQSLEWLTLRLEKQGGPEHLTREEIDKAITNIHIAVERARRITHQMLGSVRKNEHQFSKIELEALVDDAMAMVSRTAMDAGVDLAKQMDPGLAEVWTNPGSLRQVVTNLLINAVQASVRGDSVAIATEDLGDAYTLTVTDTGAGIPVENLDHIFEPFFTTKPAGEGTGLGLFVVRTMLDSLGGNIAVDSRPGRGTRFLVRLPKDFSAGAATTDDTYKGDPLP